MFVMKKENCYFKICHPWLYLEGRVKLSLVMLLSCLQSTLTIITTQWKRERRVSISISMLSSVVRVGQSRLMLVILVWVIYYSMYWLAHSVLDWSWLSPYSQRDWKTVLCGPPYGWISSGSHWRSGKNQQSFQAWNASGLVATTKFLFRLSCWQGREEIRQVISKSPMKYSSDYFLPSKFWTDWWAGLVANL